MRLSGYICDRCGDQYLQSGEDVLPSAKGIAFNTGERADLCPECATEYDEMKRSINHAFTLQVRGFLSQLRVR